MALITDLPAASGLSNTDLLVIDTGSQTQKLQAQNAGASASNAGLVTTGAQTIAGTKTFLKTVVVDDTTSNGSGLSFRFSDKNNIAYAAMWAAFSNYGGRLFFRETSGNASGVTDYNEVYRLPNPDADRTSNATYDILTTKNFGTDATSESASAPFINSSSNVVLRKCGRVITAYCDATLTSAAASWSTLFTVPTGWRPSANIASVGIVYDNSTLQFEPGYAVLQPNGAVLGSYSLGAHRYFLQFIFII